MVEMGLQRGFAWLLYGGMFGNCEENVPVGNICRAITCWGRPTFLTQVDELCSKSALATLLLRGHKGAPEWVLKWCLLQAQSASFEFWPVELRRVILEALAAAMRHPSRPRAICRDVVSGEFRALWTCVFRQLDDPGDVCRVRRVCREWRAVVDSDSMAWALRIRRRFFCEPNEDTHALLQYMLLTPPMLGIVPSSSGTPEAAFKLRIWTRESILPLPPTDKATDGACQWCGTAKLRLLGRKIWSCHPTTLFCAMEHLEHRCERCGLFTEEFSGAVQDYSYADRWK